MDGERSMSMQAMLDVSDHINPHYYEAQTLERGLLSLTVEHHTNAVPWLGPFK
jgi:hypothetical protein